MRFDSNRAWKEATAAVKANREVVFALAGVFFLLPNLLFAIVHPQPETPAGLEGEAAASFLGQYFAEAAPLMLVTGLVQAIGTLALLTLFTDRTRPTVGQAIREGAGALLFYIAAQIVLGLGFGLAGALVLGVLGATGVPALVGLGLVIVGVAAIYVLVKSSLTAPVAAVEKVRHPIHILRRSWRLTKGNSVRLALFYALLLIAFTVVGSVLMIVVGTLLTAVAGDEAGQIGGAVISSALTAIGLLYFASVVAAAHRQLAGPSPEAVSATFE